MNNKITISYKIAIDFTSLRAAFFQQRNWIKFWNSKTLSKAFTDHFPQSSCRFSPVPSRPFRHPCKWHFRVLVSPSLYTVNRSIVRSQLLWNSYRMDDTTTRLNCHLPPIFSSTHSLTGSYKVSSRRPLIEYTVLFDYHYSDDCQHRQPEIPHTLPHRVDIKNAIASTSEKR